jgi:hypothetical protein
VATVLASVGAVVALPAARCGGDDEGDAGALPEDRGAGATPVELREFAIDPARLELQRPTPSAVAVGGLRRWGVLWGARVRVV